MHIEQVNIETVKITSSSGVGHHIIIIGTCL